ncbi:flagellar protein FliT [Niallia oryzisoli]|uniref:Flagellar protein FliT n=1 Tax=Niallia oryzisoli TaxID=1737571 RepID=A0ABZ2C9S6_9BACI
MSAVKDYYLVTIELIKLLENEQSNDRDGKIAKVEGVLEKREGFMQKMKPPFSQEDQETGKRLVELEKNLAKLLAAEKAAIKKDLLTLNKKKQSQTKYHNPYEALPITDGVFYDKRK